jgi:very-short-patch-repair endonuclease
MAESLLSKLESSRKELLDLGMRNSLLNFRQLRTKGIQIIGEQSVSLFKILVTEGRTMSFLAKSEPASAVLPFEPSPVDQEALYNDSKLQTKETEDSLARRLLNTFYAARTNLEEQGVNILYLALGMLHWFESESSQEERLAPLVLIPVELDRSSVRDKIKIKYSQEEIGENISLRAKMRAEFGIDILVIDNIEDFDIDSYFSQVSQRISGQSRWKISPNSIELGFFSFNKFLIYNDLDNSKWPAGKSPVEHPLLQSLLQEGFRDKVPGPGENVFIDTETGAGEFYQVVDADSSQLLTMIATRNGDNQLIQGPPGTGKSQTITNLIADAVGQGKKVLFVAEKMAALDVVKRKLDFIGLGEICLELHSNKSNKKELHTELLRILSLGKPQVEKLAEEVRLLSKHKAELNEYCQAVNTPVPKSRLTVQQIIGRLLQLEEIRQGQSLPKIDKAQLQSWNADMVQRAESMAERIEARLQNIGVPDRLLFWGCELNTLLPSDQEALMNYYLALVSACTALHELTCTIADHFGFERPIDRQSAVLLMTACGLAAKRPDLTGIAVENHYWINNRPRIEFILQSAIHASELLSKHQQVLLPAAWTENLLATRQSLQTHGRKWYRFLIADYKRARNHVASLYKSAPPRRNHEKIECMEDIMEFQAQKKIISEAEGFASEIFGPHWTGLQSDLPRLQVIADYLHDVHMGIQERECPPNLLVYLARHENEDGHIFFGFYQSLSSALQAQEQSTSQLLQSLSFNESKRFPNGGFLALTFSEQIALTAEWVADPSEIHKVVAWNVQEEIAREEGLQILTSLSSSWEQADRLLKTALQKSWYEYLLESAMKTIPALSRFQRDSHEEVIQQFRKVDRLQLQLNRALVAHSHWTALPGADAGGQVNTLKREFNKKARFKPIRQVVEEAGTALQAIKPVFMMSPLSIANYLPPGMMEFDIVIFDEASQIKPVEALGAILRAKQVVVVGDSKQLPPTSFFDSLAEESEDEENVTADIQSILGLCHAQGIPSNMLRWHYRSRHESLITLSNHEFYENKLVIFPSPGSLQQLGLRYHHLKDTVYDRGKTRTNIKEAQHVSEMVMQHASTYPQLSLGVVAFSSAQREAIESALEILRKKNPTSESFFNKSSHEPFFVKNLENVQGDERDVIFISIGYGRTQEGYIAMSFGPLTNEGGERRLNVLITRARLRCEIFTNLTAADIDLTRTRSRGIAALKHFLYYAEHGRLHLTEETGLPADSPFEENVADRLTSLGYIVRKQVGSQGFYIDLAIVDPEHPGRYIIGIECDGAAYHSARSARDRDRLRQEVLENMGWTIHRIWSTDWFRHPEEELKRTIHAIEKARERLHLYGHEKEELADPRQPAVDEFFDIAREIEPKPGFATPAYLCASFPKDLINLEIHLYPVGKLSDWVFQVIQKESPVHFDEMARRITDAAGVSKIGSRIREVLERATRYLKDQKKIRINGEFLWMADSILPAIRDRSNLPISSRKLKFISPEEITLAVLHVVQESVAISPDDATALALRLFGFNRITEEMRTEMEMLIDKVIQDGIVRRESGFLKEV